jgi:anaerobic selenocysteine-containing dehydrogenase
LQRRLERGAKARLRHAALARLQPHGLLDLGLRTGPYGAGFRPFARGLSLRKLRKHPHGMDLGPLEPALPARLYTADGKIHAAPAPMLKDVARLRARLLEAEADVAAAADGGFDLLLIGRRQLRSNNSWMHNYPRLMKGRDRCTLLLHPADAAARGIEDGGMVRVGSRAGSVEVPAELSDEVMRGVVSLPHGFGHGRAGIGTSVAAAHPGASANDVTDDQLVDALGGNAALNGVPVRVEAVVPAAPVPILPYAASRPEADTRHL